MEEPIFLVSIEASKREVVMGEALWCLDRFFDSLDGLKFVQLGANNGKTQTGWKRMDTNLNTNPQRT